MIFHYEKVSHWNNPPLDVMDSSTLESSELEKVVPHI